MLTFSLGQQAFIELNKLLKLMQLAQSGGEANAIIEAKEVLVNNSIEIQKRKKLRVGDCVKFQKTTVQIKQ